MHVFSGIIADPNTSHAVRRELGGFGSALNSCVSDKSASEEVPAQELFRLMSSNTCGADVKALTAADEPGEVMIPIA